MSLVSFLTVHRAVQAEIIDFSTKPWSFREKVEQLKGLDRRIAEAKNASTTALKAIHDDLTSRSWFDVEWLQHAVSFGNFGAFAEKQEEVERANRATALLVDKLFANFAKEVLQATGSTTEDVIEASRLVLGHRPQEVSLVVTVAERYMKEGAFREAELLLEQVAKKGVVSDALFINLVTALLQQNKFVEAEQKIAEIKVMLTVEQMGRLRAHLELKRIESLAGQEKFDEAERALYDMMRGQGEAAALKQMAVRLSVKKEVKAMEALPEATDVQKTRFMARSKKLFGQLDDYAKTRWSVETEISELDFWLWLFFTQPKIAGSKQLHDISIAKFKELIASEIVQAALVLKQLERFIHDVATQHTHFIAAFQAVAKEAVKAEKDLSVFTAHKAKFMERLKGTKDTVGLNMVRAVANELIDFLKKEARFQEKSLQMQLVTLKLALDVGEKEVELCEKTAQANLHLLPAGIEAPAQLLAITS